MNNAVLDSLVTGFEAIEPTLAPTDDGDRHVLAAAILCRADVIVTFNLDDFPDDALAPYRIEACWGDANNPHDNPCSRLHGLAFRSRRIAK